ncbi:MAG: porin family protein [Gemmatimonadales bacterium]|nr:MAG: porin family protein [Gemmatimonadales bacterium]
MKGRNILAMAAAAALVFAPATTEAQQAGSIELGVVGGYTVFDDEVGIDNAPRIGGRAGFFILPNLSVELDVTYAEPELEDQPGWQGRTFISHELYQARLLYTAWLGDTERLGLLLGAGYSYDHFYRPRRVASRGGGPGGLLGFRFKLTDLFSLRAEATGYYVPEDDDAFIPRPSTFNLGAQAGLSVILRDRTETVVEQLPAPPPDTVTIEREVEPELPEGTPTQICLATGENVTVYITPQGDTLVGPRRVNVADLGPGVAFAGEYADGRDWFVNDEPVDFDDLEYVRSGGIIGLDCADIMQVGEFEGVPLFADAGAERPFETLYVPVRPGEWQAYQTDLAEVRGQDQQ